MRLLLDTHALLWWTSDDPRLSYVADAALLDPANEIFVSAVSAWEIATKYRLGKLPGARLLAEDIVEQIAADSFLPLSVTVRHGQYAGGLPGAHKDPFDRLLIAQALLEDLALVSSETLFDAYGVTRLW